MVLFSIPTPLFAVGTLIPFALFAYVVWNVVHSFSRRSTVYLSTSEKDVIADPNAKKSRKVAVVGAGPSGLVTVKELLAEGHNVTCFENYSDVGGVFLYSDEKGGVYDSTLLTISNFLMAFSDFLPQKFIDQPLKASEFDEKKIPLWNRGHYRFWHHSEYFDYLKAYTQHFRLTERASFQFHTKVTRVSKVGKMWRVETETKVPGGEPIQKSDLYEALAICSGTHQKAFTPSFPGMEDSKIQFVHSEQYKSADDPKYKGKHVVCVGAGETGADVAAEISESASKAWLSMRRPPHVIPRDFCATLCPSDVHTARIMFYPNHKWLDFMHHLDQSLRLLTGTTSWGIKLFKGKMGMGDPNTAKIAELSFRSGGGVTEQFITKNDKFVGPLVSGKLIEKTGIARFVGTDSIEFTNGSKLSGVDTVMFCTGYKDEFDFFDGFKVPPVRQMYKHAFHADENANLAFIGFVRPSTGGVPVCSEMVARYWSLILSGKRKLPDNWRERIQQEKESEANVVRIHADRLNSLVIYGDFVQSLGEHIGCAPKISSFFLKDPLLALRMVFGPFLSVQYRLVGAGANPEHARNITNQVPLLTPLPISIMQTAITIASWIGGAVADFRPPSW